MKTPENSQEKAEKKWQLNEKGQCLFCLKKPLVYKRDHHYFCARCDRAYDLKTGEFIANWCWNIDGTRKKNEYTAVINPPQPESEGVEILEEWRSRFSRPWDEFEKSVKEVGLKETIRDFQSHFLSLAYQLLQAQAQQIRREERFIGLTDKHGKKIYKGDKLRDSRGIGVVTWLDSRGGWAVYVEGEGYYYPHSYGEYQLRDTEIVK